MSDLKITHAGTEIQKTNTGPINPLATLGQAGSVFTNAATNPLIPPAGKAFVAITCIGTTKFHGTNGLVAEDPNKFISEPHSAHSSTETVSKGVETTGFTVNGSGDDTYQIQGIPSGRTVVSSSLSVVVTTNSGTDSTGTFTVATAQITSVSSSGLITFSGTGGLASNFIAEITYVLGEVDSDEGIGGLPVLATTEFPAGLTIYGRWTKIQLAAAQATDGIIAYIG